MNEIRTLPNPEEVQQAADCYKQLAALLATDPKALNNINLQCINQTISLPTPAIAILLEALQELAKGNAVKLTTVQKMLTTQQVADLLQVSRPHVVKLIDSGELPVLMVGVHRRIPAKAVLAYKKRWKEQARKALDEMVIEDQKAGLYDLTPEDFYV